MLTITTERNKYPNRDKYIEGACLSSDTKPTQGIENGSCLIEMDTSTVFFFDEQNHTWRAW